MAQKIYQVEIIITYTDSFENHFETYLFDEREREQWNVLIIFS